MSSVFRAPSQMPPFKRYLVEQNGGFMQNATFTGTVSLTRNTVLVDMGKTVLHTDGRIYRKVMVGPFTGLGNIGYICLDSDLSSGPNGQGVSRMN